MTSQFLDENYDPKIITGDVSTAVFQERPDLITVHKSLQWTRNLLTIFVKAYNQANIGVLIKFDCIDRLKYFSKYNLVNLIYVQYLSKSCR